MQADRDAEDLAHYHANLAVNRSLSFARVCHDHAEALRADLYVAHAVQSCPAAHALADRTGGRRVCDVVEVPRFDQRASPRDWHPVVMDTMNRWVACSLDRCDALWTVGDGLAGGLVSHGRPVTVIPNFRDDPPEPPAPAGVRARLGLGPQDVLLVAIGRMTTGLDTLLPALARLPAAVHLVTLGRFLPETYRGEADRLAAACGVADRCHFLGHVPYAELAATAADGDIAVLVLDPATPNSRLSLPNRLFDSLFAGLPVVTPPLPDVVALVERHGIGIALPGIGVGDWHAGLTAALARRAELRAAVRRALPDLTWQANEHLLLEAVAPARSVTIVGMRDLLQDNRIKRFALTLARHDIATRVCTLSYLTEPQVPPDSRITYHQWRRF